MSRKRAGYCEGHLTHKGSRYTLFFSSEASGFYYGFWRHPAQRWDSPTFRALRPIGKTDAEAWDILEARARADAETA